jgi:phosphoserine phosphatase
MDWSDEIKIKLEKLLDVETEKKIAVFDADGTIWYGDIGESFFRHQIENKLAPGILNIQDPMKHYKSLDRTSTASACSWLAEINKGLSEKHVLGYAHDYYQNKFLSKPTDPIKSLIENLHRHKFEVWICTASPRYTVEPCLKELGISKDFLIGAEVEIGENLILTDKPIVPVPYKEGKKLALQKRLSAQPLLVVGNSLGDLEMMKWASHMALGVNYLPHLKPVEVSERGLIEECQKRGWPMQFFNVNQ